MISCDTVKKELSSFIEGSLAPNDASLIEEHLTSCPDCRQVVSQVETIMRRMQSVSSVSPSSDFDRQLRDRIIHLDQSGWSVRWRSSWSYGLSGAAILVAVYMFVSIQLTETPVQINTSKVPVKNVQQTVNQTQPAQFVKNDETGNDKSAPADSIKPSKNIEERNINLIEK